jgi:hypothetical protein
VKKFGILLAVTFACFAGVWFSPACRIVRSFDNLERNAHNTISGADFQAWAMRLLAEYPMETNFSSDRLGTNFPFASLYHAPAYVVIREASTNSPAHVFLMWGGGFIGHCGFEIGPTNFVSGRGVHKWQDGVYFWTDPNR